MKAYRRRFLQLVEPLKDISDPVLESKFFSGLKEEIQIKMRLFTLVGLKEKMSMAQLIEETEAACQKRWTNGLRGADKKEFGSGSSKYSGFKNLGPRSFTLNPNLSTTSPATASAVTTRDSGEHFTSRGSYRRLSDNELKNKISKGLCFRCNEKFSPGHRCKKQEL